MRPPKPSPFFRPHLMDEAAAPPRRPVLTSTRRRMLAWVVALAVFVLAAGAAVYLAHPERWQQPAAKKTARADHGKTRVIQSQPGVADIEVQRGKERRVYRFRQVDKQIVVEEVKPPQPKKSWWQRLFGRD